MAPMVRMSKRFASSSLKARSSLSTAAAKHACDAELFATSDCIQNITAPGNRRFVVCLAGEWSTGQKLLSCPVALSPATGCVAASCVQVMPCEATWSPRRKLMHLMQIDAIINFEKWSDGFGIDFHKENILIPVHDLRDHRQGSRPCGSGLAMSAEYQKLTTVSVAPEGTTAALLGDGGEKVRAGRANEPGTRWCFVPHHLHDTKPAFPSPRRLVRPQTLSSSKIHLDN